MCLKVKCSVIYLPLLTKYAYNVKDMFSEKNELQKMQMKHITGNLHQLKADKTASLTKSAIYHSEPYTLRFEKIVDSNLAQFRAQNLPQLTYRSVGKVFVQLCEDLGSFLIPHNSILSGGGSIRNYDYFGLYEFLGQHRLHETLSLIIH